MKNFNLLISTSRFNETNAKSELWFLLLILGDEYPIISNLNFQGLLTAFTKLEKKDVTEKTKNILAKNRNFFQFILKIVPIDYVCETNINTIAKIIDTTYQNHISKKNSFKIELKRRKNESIERKSFIETIAKKFENRVDLEQPDKIIRFEILGNITGISYLNPFDIIKTSF